MFNGKTIKKMGYGVFLLVVPVLLVGCGFGMGDCGGCFRSKSQRTIDVSRPLMAHKTLAVATPSGDIRIQGGQAEECKVKAIITVQAESQALADQIVQEVNIELVEKNGGLSVEWRQPQRPEKFSVAVDYDITVPRQTATQATSQYGDITLESLDGKQVAKTNSGDISADHLQGPVDLCTAYGDVSCSHVGSGPGNFKSSSGDISLKESTFASCRAETGYGDIKADKLEGPSFLFNTSSGDVVVNELKSETAELQTSYGDIEGRQLRLNRLSARTSSGDVQINASDSTPELNAELVSSYGDVDLSAPSGYTGQVEMATLYGSINTGRPITVCGDTGKKHLTGTVGQGKGRLILKTSSGDVQLR